MILTAIALASAVQIEPDIIIGDDGCRWIRRAPLPAPRVVKPSLIQHVAPAASAPRRPKPKHILKGDYAGYEKEGCEDVTPPPTPMVSILPPPEDAPFSPIPDEPIAAAPAVTWEHPVDIGTPDTFVEGGGGNVATFAYGGEVFGGGGGICAACALPCPPAVPEPWTWALLVAGFGAIGARRA